MFRKIRPRFLIKNGKIEEGRAALSRMRGADTNSEIIIEEMSQIQGNLEYELSLGKASYADCFRGNMAARTWCG